MEEFATHVCEGLRQHGIEAILTGGAVVTIYTKNEYQSGDADFVTTADRDVLTAAMTQMGFKPEGRRFVRPETDFFVEFPGRILEIGNEVIRDWNERRSKAGVLSLLRPTECVMDRLAAFYHWNDPQSLDQALLVGRRYPIDLDRIREWSKGEGHTEKYKIFRAEMDRERTAPRKRE